MELLYVLVIPIEEDKTSKKNFFLKMKFITYEKNETKSLLSKSCKKYFFFYH
jgi:hypothetical protein